MPLILWLSFVTVVGVYICAPVQDPDLWWHITIGRWIVANGTVPSVDHWNLFGQGQPWRAYSWLPEIFFALIDGRFGDHGLLVFKLLLSVGLTAALAWGFGRLARDNFIGALLGAFAAGACANHFTLRPQSFTWIYLIVLLVLLDRISASGMSKARGAGILGVMALWANTHLTPSLGMAAIGGWLLSGRRGGVSPMVLIFALFGTVLTPYLGGEWITFFSKADHPLRYRTIVEFGPATIMQYPTAFLALAAALLLALLFYNPRAIALPKLIVGGVFVLGGLSAVKFIPIAAIYLGALIALVWRDGPAGTQRFGNLGQGIERLRGVINWIPKEGLAFVLLALAAISVTDLWRTPVHPTVVPVQALDFIQQHKLPTPLLNTFGQGGYVMYRMSDKKGKLANLVPIDGRTNVVPEEVFKEFDAAVNGRSGWEKFLKRVNPNTILWRSGSPLVQLLEVTGEWCMVMRSGTDALGHVILVQRQQYLEQLRSRGITSEGCDRPDPEET